MRVSVWKLLECHDHLRRDDYVSSGRVDAYLPLCGAIINAQKCLEYKLYPLTIIKQINSQYDTQNLSLA